jgi:hypothetical protein
MQSIALSNIIIYVCVLFIPNHAYFDPVAG